MYNKGKGKAARLGQPASSTISAEPAKPNNLPQLATVTSHIGDAIGDTGDATIEALASLGLSQQVALAHVNSPHVTETVQLSANMPCPLQVNRPQRVRRKTAQLLCNVRAQNLLVICPVINCRHHLCCRKANYCAVEKKLL